MRLYFLLFMVTCLSTLAPSQNANNTNGKTPVLIELFTSEGCSSCPPADNWLEQIDASQPISGAQLIVLSEHVDYFDREGWKDPYSLESCADRQNRYVQAIGLNTAYTPQAIVNGEAELKLNQPQQVQQVLLKAASSPHTTLNIGAVTLDESASPLLRAHIEINGVEAHRNADIFAAVALDHARSHVVRGENEGKMLTHVAVVQQFVKIGNLEKGKVFSQDVKIKLHPKMNSENLRLIVFVQEPDGGKVLGAALEKTGPAGREDSIH